MLKNNLCFACLFFLSMTCFSQVGINTATPRATLDINGNLKIKPINTETANNSSYLAVDNTTKEVKIISASSGNRMLLNYIVFEFSNVRRDYIFDFETRIKTSDYTLVIVESTFSSELAMSRGSHCPKKVYAYTRNGGWRLTADYDGCVTNGKVNGNWIIKCLVINKSIIKEVDPITVDAGGNNTASASCPAGL